MIERDFLLRQIQQAIQALAAVLLSKRNGTPEAQVALAEGLQMVTGMDAARLARLSREATLELARDEGAFSPEMAVAVADLLRESGDDALRARARWLYEAVLAAGEVAPLDIHERIAALPAEA